MIEIIPTDQSNWQIDMEITVEWICMPVIAAENAAEPWSKLIAWYQSPGITESLAIPGLG